ncbi:MAG: fatty-acid--CoA ligase [Hoylesella enoeca]|uniref:fatty-acid--CoA ligase n=1 Tax=Hoylesella enoeca TaxID=76123 RepID=UPI003F9EE443
MKKKENLVGYEKPECAIVELATETFICGSPKVTPSAPGFEEEDWEDKGDIEAGEFETE